jgi:hypothetical protein
MSAMSEKIRINPARLAALAAGEKTFDIGQPCANSHLPGIRYASNGQCVQCAADKYKRRILAHPRPPKALRIKRHANRTAEQNRRRNELLCKQRREAVDNRRLPRALYGLEGSLSNPVARERSDRLDAMIRNGANLIGRVAPRDRSEER